MKIKIINNKKKQDTRKTTNKNKMPENKWQIPMTQQQFGPLAHGP